MLTLTYVQAAPPLLSGIPVALIDTVEPGK